MSATQLRWGSVTMSGRVRAYNQDAVLTTGQAFAVADGMGGHAAGDIASRTALDSFSESLPGEPDIETLVAVFHAANRAVIDRASLDADLRGMGTTLCALALVRVGDVERLAIANVGDSRAYVLQDGRLQQVSRDHSYVEDLVAMGQLTHEEARSHPQKNIVTRALGIDPDLQVDVWEVMPFAGDRYLLCSDGLTNEVPDDAIREVLLSVDDPQEAADRLGRMADDNGGRDNISVVVVDVVDAPASNPSGSVPVVTAGRPAPGAPPAPGTSGGRADGGGRSAVAAETTVDVSSLGDWLADAPELDDTLPPDEPGVVAGAPQFPVVAELRPTRSPVRRVVFVLLLFAIVLVGLAGTAYYARNVYTVRLQGDAVLLEQGRSIAWFQPTFEKTYDVTRAGLPPAKVADVEAGREFSSSGAADQYVANLKDEAASIATTTTAPATTTTVASTSTTDLATTSTATGTATAPATTVLSPSPSTSG